MKAFHFRNKKKEINTEPTFDTEILSDEDIEELVKSMINEKPSPTS